MEGATESDLGSMFEEIHHKSDDDSRREEYSSDYGARHSPTNNETDEDMLSVGTIQDTRPHSHDRLRESSWDRRKDEDQIHQLFGAMQRAFEALESKIQALPTVLQDTQLSLYLN